MKTKEELNALKEEVETLNKKLAELTEEELAQVSGGKGVTAPGWERLDGNYCYKDCGGRLNKDNCGYTFCKWNRWDGTVSNDP